MPVQDRSISYGHLLLNVSDIERHRQFWVDALGGAPTRVGTSTEEVVNFSGVLIFLCRQTPTGSSKGTVVNHFGLQVPKLRATVDRLRAAGYAITTTTEVSAANAKNIKDDLAFIPDQNTCIAYILGPDNTKLELVENKALLTPIAFHHLHFFTPQVAEMKAWYVKVFGAIPGKRGSFEAADVPGANLTFSATADPIVGTRGRLLDHIGFEVNELEKFCRRLDATGVTLDRPYAKVPEANIATAFITDPWGTYIALTEGLITASATA
jgi:catechol 2,3-dioxygenase-like lactoylglutathione lyase family enzyme